MVDRDASNASHNAASSMPASQVRLQAEPCSKLAFGPVLRGLDVEWGVCKGLFIRVFCMDRGVPGGPWCVGSRSCRGLSQCVLRGVAVRWTLIITATELR